MVSRSLHRIWCSSLNNSIMPTTSRMIGRLICFHPQGRSIVTHLGAKASSPTRPINHHPRSIRPTPKISHMDSTSTLKYPNIPPSNRISSSSIRPCMRVQFLCACVQPVEMNSQSIFRSRLLCMPRLQMPPSKLLSLTWQTTTTLCSSTRWYVLSKTSTSWRLSNPSRWIFKHSQTIL